MDKCDLNEENPQRNSESNLEIGKKWSVSADNLDGSSFQEAEEEEDDDPFDAGNNNESGDVILSRERVSTITCKLRAKKIILEIIPPSF